MRRHVGTLLILVLVLGSLPYASQGEYVGLETIIEGRVTDADTGDPIENVTIYVRNLSLELFFTTTTDRNGEYEIQVGRSGNFTVIPIVNIYREITLNVPLGSMFETYRLDIALYKHETNVYGICGKEGWILSNFTILFRDRDTSELKYEVITDGNGRFETSLPPGNYTAIMQDELFPRTTHDFTVEEGRREFLSLQFNTSVDRQSPDHLFHQDSIVVPPHSQVLFVFETELESRMLLSTRNTGRMDVIELSLDMYNYYFNGTPDYEPEDYTTPYLAFDFMLKNTTGGGGDVSVWRSPYCILIRNWNDEEHICRLSLEYDYGNFKKIGYMNSTIPAFVEEEVVEKRNGDEKNYLFAVSFVLLILVMAYLITAHMKPSGRISKERSRKDQ